VLKEISRQNREHNPWAPFQSGKDFQHTISRLVLSQSRECTGRLSALFQYTMRSDTAVDESEKRYDVKRSQSMTPVKKKTNYTLTSLDSHIEKLPVPHISRQIIGSTGLASVDPTEYLQRVFMCNPLLTEVLDIHPEERGKKFFL